MAAWMSTAMMVSMEDPMAASPPSAHVDRFVLAPRLDLCLDFANTLAWRGSTPIESLRGLPDVLEWCVESGALPKSIADELRKWMRSHPNLAAEIFSETIAIREALYRIFHSAGSGVSSDGDLRLLNEALRRAPMRGIVERTARGFGWRIEPMKPSAAAILAPVLWSAADLLVGPSLARVRHCANERCLWLFFDDSKNGARRWCSMQSCGNRAKAHRHYLRQKRT
ncbi:MAG: CGNR zinc finger domain-containing protein [Candidatus Binataceae bacterium]